MSEARRTVVESLRRPGPILDAFGCGDLPTDTPAVRRAHQLLESLADGDPTPATAGFPREMVRMARDELDALDVDALARWIRSLPSAPDRDAVALIPPDKGGSEREPCERSEGGHPARHHAPPASRKPRPPSKPAPPPSIPPCQGG